MLPRPRKTGRRGGNNGGDVGRPRTDQVEAAEVLLREDDAEQEQARRARESKRAAEEADCREERERTRPQREAEAALVEERMKEAQRSAIPPGFGHVRGMPWRRYS